MTDAAHPDEGAVPVLAVAVVCEKVLDEKDNVHSLIRIADTVSIQSSPPEVGQVITLPVALFFSFKAGEARGSFRFDIVVVNPDKHDEVAGGIELEFKEPPNSGHNVCSPVRIRWQGPGLYWFELRLRSRALARVPLFINVSTPTPEERIHEHCGIRGG